MEEARLVRGKSLNRLPLKFGTLFASRRIEVSTLMVNGVIPVNINA